MTAPLAWFDAKPTGVQLLVLAAILDPLGLVGGYLLLPDLLGVAPTTGAGYGLVAASVPLGAWALYSEGVGGDGEGDHDGGSDDQGRNDAN